MDRRMLVAILVILCVIIWTGMACVYFRTELGAWFDNRYGPDRKETKAPKGKPFWRFYG